MSESRRSIYCTSPPAKLNLFLEILGRRADGYHELDTVMVAIDWRDELELQMTAEPGISLDVQWLPSREAVAAQLGVHPLDVRLDVPTDASNLVHRALALVSEATRYAGGWNVRLGKRIPSGAGMGGASSDAAATLRLAAMALTDSENGASVCLSSEKLRELAALLGSDVPFFLGRLSCDDDASEPPGFPGQPPSLLARAQGRGEEADVF